MTEGCPDFQHPERWLVCAVLVLHQAQRDGYNRVSSVTPTTQAAATE